MHGRARLYRRLRGGGGPDGGGAMLGHRRAARLQPSVYLTTSGGPKSAESSLQLALT